MSTGGSGADGGQVRRAFPSTRGRAGASSHYLHRASRLAAAQRAQRGSVRAERHEDEVEHEEGSDAGHGEGAETELSTQAYKRLSENGEYLRGAIFHGHTYHGPHDADEAPVVPNIPTRADQQFAFHQYFLGAGGKGVKLLEPKACDRCVQRYSVDPMRRCTPQLGAKAVKCQYCADMRQPCTHVAVKTPEFSMTLNTLVQLADLLAILYNDPPIALTDAQRFIPPYYVSHAGGDVGQARQTFAKVVDQKISELQTQFNGRLELKKGQTDLEMLKFGPMSDFELLKGCVLALNRIAAAQEDKNDFTRIIWGFPAKVRGQASINDIDIGSTLDAAIGGH